MTRPNEHIDMSAEALVRRLEQIRSLYRLMLYLRRGRELGPVVPTP